MTGLNFAMSLLNDQLSKICSCLEFGWGGLSQGQVHKCYSDSSPLKSSDLHRPPNFEVTSAGSSVNHPVPLNPGLASVSKFP